MRTIRLRSEWLAALENEFYLDYMVALRGFLRQEKLSGKKIYPPGQQIFSALEATPPETVKVVILGQDPYHRPNLAHGLSFSVPKGQIIPPSLRNIFRELERDLAIVPSLHGDLSAWAQRGVLLLNSVLSVESGKAGSHQGKGWEKFTAAIIRKIDLGVNPVVFMLWGKHAQQIGAGIDRKRHLVLTAPHPSPLSAHAGFFGCSHFSRANLFLRNHGRGEVDWRLPE